MERVIEHVVGFGGEGLRCAHPPSGDDLVCQKEVPSASWKSGSSTSYRSIAHKLSKISIPDVAAAET